MAAPAPPLLMVDPSLVLSSDGFEWLKHSAQGGIVISATFWDWVHGERDLDLSPFAPDARVPTGAVRQTLRVLLGGVERFSEAEVQLSPETDAVRVRLLARDDSAAELLADEWTFLQSNSTMVAKLRHPIDAFRDAGAAILEFGSDVGRTLMQKVIPPDKIPPALRARDLAKAGVKFTALGGAMVGGGTLGGIIGALGGPAGAGIGGLLGAGTGGALAQAALINIDP